MATPRAKFKITADNSDYKRKLKAALKDTDRFAGSVAQALRRGAQAGAVALTATTAALTALSVSAAKTADQLAKTSDKLGIATEKLAALQLAGRLTGVQNDKLTLSMQRMTRRISEAAQGSGEAQDALKELGLDAQELNELTLDEQMHRVAIAMQDVTNQSDRVRLGFKLFDSEGVDLIRTLDLVADDFEDVERQARLFGVAISRVDAAQIENAGDQIERAKTAAQGLGTNIALAVAPLVKQVAGGLADAAEEAEGFKDEVQATMEALVVGANFAANSVRGIQAALLGAKLALLQLRRPADEQPSGSVRGMADELGGAAARRRALQAKFGAKETPTAADVDAEIDATARAIDTLLGKFLTADQALAEFRTTQQEAVAAARERVEAQSEEILGPISLEGFREREAERQEILVSMVKETQRRIVAEEKRAAAEREKIEQRLQNQVTQFRRGALQAGISLLHTLGAKNEGLAKAAIAIEKAAAVTSIIVSTNRAAAAALAPPPLGAGPIAGAPLAAAIKAAGYANAAATAALGIGQIASVGSGSTGTTIGTRTNPVFTDTVNQEPQGRAQSSVIEVHVYGDILSEDRLERVLGNIFDRDGVVIKQNHRQAMTIRGGS